MSGEEHGKSFLDLLFVGLTGFGLGAFFKAIGLCRRYNKDGTQISLRQFSVEVISAGGVAMLSAWILDSLHIDFERRAFILGMLGYVGGPLLDICYQQMQKTLDAAFEGLQKYLSEGKWQK